MSSSVKVASNETNAINVDAAPHAAAAKSTADDPSCGGIPDQDRAIGPFGDRQQITAVTPLTETMTHLKFSWNQLRGAKIFVRATPGMTKQWLSRLIHCHMATEAGVAGSSSDVADPLTLSPLDVSVNDTSQGFVVYVRTEKPDTDLANRVLEVSKRLLPSS